LNPRGIITFHDALTWPDGRRAPPMREPLRSMGKPVPSSRPGGFAAPGRTAPALLPWRGIPLPEGAGLRHGDCEEGRSTPGEDRSEK
jgi:hypothetical protein